MNRILKSCVTGLSILLAAVLLMYSSENSVAKADRATLNAVYQRAFYETCELISGMQVNLKKLSVSGSAAKEMELLGEITREAQGAQSNLSMLPINVNSVTATLKFVNQTGDYAQTLAGQLASGGALSSDDRSQLLLLLESCTNFGMQLNQLLSDYNEGRLAFGEYDFSTDAGGELKPLTNPASEYPVLLYDGPFSDGRKGDEMKGLHGSALTVDEALASMAGYLGGSIEDIAYTGDALGPAECYEYSFAYNGYRVNAGVTKIGGHVLYMLPDATDYSQALSDDECVERAVAFARERGHGDTEVSYHRRFEGVLTVNLAPVQTGVILYPDLIKVQVSMKDGCIVGLEARNYYQNHVPRQLGEATLTQAQAISLAGAELACDGARLCVIPVNTAEALCYEVSARSGEDEYLVYIDAFTGEERALYQVVNTDEGTLVQ